MNAADIFGVLLIVLGVVATVAAAFLNNGFVLVAGVLVSSGIVIIVTAGQICRGGGLCRGQGYLLHTSSTASTVDTKSVPRPSLAELVLE